MRLVRVAASGILAGAVAWAVVTGWSAIVGSHWAYLVVLALTAVAGVFLMLRRAPSGLSRRAVLTRRTLWVLAWSLLGGLTVWTRPYVADASALAALPASVQVTDSWTRTVLTPAGAPEGDAGGGAGAGSGVGLVFVPGALVEPAAYEPVLARVAASGHTVVIVKPPMGVGFLAGDVLAAARAAAPSVRLWAVGGHSLGGVVAAGQSDGAAGLVLWASYPAGRVEGLPVLSVSGLRDGLTTPADIAETRDRLPADTTFVAIDGMVHSDFGDYGDQRGDGARTLRHPDGQGLLVKATAEFLDSLG